MIGSIRWLDVGYKRPGTPKGLPLDKAQNQVLAWSADIRRLALVESIGLSVRKSD